MQLIHVMHASEHHMRIELCIKLLLIIIIIIKNKMYYK